MKHLLHLFLASLLAFAPVAHADLRASSGAFGPVAITGGNAVFRAGSSAAQVAVPADTTEDIVATVNMPVLTANASFLVEFAFTSTNNTNAKTARARLGGIGGTAFLSVNYGSSTGGYAYTVVSNRAATNSQFGVTSSGLFHPLGASGVGITGAIDTSVATTLVITGQKNTAGDTFQLEFFRVTLIDP